MPCHFFEKDPGLRVIESASVVPLLNAYGKIELQCHISFFLEKIFFANISMDLKQANQRRESQAATVHHGELREAFLKTAPSTAERLSEFGVRP